MMVLILLSGCLKTAAIGYTDHYINQIRKVVGNELSDREDGVPWKEILVGGGMVLTGLGVTIDQRRNRKKFHGST